MEEELKSGTGEKGSRRWDVKDELTLQTRQHKKNTKDGVSSWTGKLNKRLKEKKKRERDSEGNRRQRSSLIPHWDAWKQGAKRLRLTFWFRHLASQADGNVASLMNRFVASLWINHAAKRRKTKEKKNHPPVKLEDVSFSGRSRQDRFYSFKGVQTLCTNQLTVFSTN